RLREVGRDRQQVMTPRAMATLATDAVVAALGAGAGLAGGPEMGRVAVQALAERFGGEGTAQVAVRVGRDGGMLHRRVPLRRPGIACQAELADLPGWVARQERLPLMARPQGVLDHGAEGPLTDPGHHLDTILNPADLVLDARVVRVDDRLVGPRQVPQLGGPHQGPGMPAALLRCELVGVARGAAEGTDERGRFRVHP